MEHLQQIQIFYMFLNNNPASMSKSILQSHPMDRAVNNKQVKQISKNFSNMIKKQPCIINKQTLMQEFLQQQSDTKIDQTMIMSFGNKSEVDPFTSVNYQQKKFSVMGQSFGQTSPTQEKTKYKQKTENCSPQKNVKSFDLIALYKSREQRIANETLKEIQYKKKHEGIFMSPINKDYLNQSISPRQKKRNRNLTDKSTILLEKSKKNISFHQQTKIKQNKQKITNNSKFNPSLNIRKPVAIQISLPQIEQNVAIKQQKSLIGQIMVDLRKVVGKLQNDSFNDLQTKSNKKHQNRLY